MLLRWAKKFVVTAAAVLLAALPVQAGPALLFDTAGGHVLYAEDADQPWYPASLTKLMTAYLVFDAWQTGKVTPDTKITVSAYANSQPKMRLGLGANKEITFDDAVKALVIKSANDMAVALAEAVAGSETEFVALMNTTAQRLGMSGTRFINPNGLPGEGQHTTARDLALLAQAIQRDYPERMPIFSMPMAQIGNKTIATHNGLLMTLPGGDGMKTGFTCSAGYNIVASATRDGRRLVAIVLGEQSPGKRAARATALLEYGFKTLAWKALFTAPTIESLPESSYDREMIRVTNLEKRFKDCKDPEPVLAPDGSPIVASADPSQPASATTALPAQTGAPITIGSIAPATAASLPAAASTPATATATAAKPQTKRTARASLKRRPLRPPGDPYREPVFTLAAP